MGITRELTVLVREDSSSLSEGLILFEGNHGIELHFLIKDYKFQYVNNAPNVLKALASGAKVDITIVKPNGVEISRTSDLVNDKVRLIITPDLIDELTEIGTHQIQFHVGDNLSEISIPPFNFEVRARLKGNKPVQEIGIVDSSKADNCVAGEDETILFTIEGKALNLIWKPNDVITASRLNAIVTAINEIQLIPGPEGKQGPKGNDGNDGTPGTNGTNGINGKSIEYIWRGTELGIRIEGQSNYTYVDLIGPQGIPGTGGEGGSGTPGRDGREVELQNSGLYIQWRYVGDASWKNLIALADLKGNDGDTWKPSVASDGTLSWVKSSTTSKPSPVNIKGPKGTNGVTPNISIGTVTTLEPNQAATISKRGTTEEPIFDFGIPKGKPGEAGAGGGGSTPKLLVDYEHTLNKELTPVSIDFSTGDITVLENINEIGFNKFRIGAFLRNVLKQNANKDLIPKEVHGADNIVGTIVSDHVIRFNNIKPTSLGDIKAWSIQDKYDILIENVFEVNKRYLVEIYLISNSYSTGIVLNRNISSAYSSENLVVVGNGKGNVSGDFGIQPDICNMGSLISIELINKSNEIIMNIKSCGGGYVTNTTLKNWNSQSYVNYIGGYLKNLQITNARNVIANGSKIKIYELGGV